MSTHRDLDCMYVFMYVIFIVNFILKYLIKNVYSEYFGIYLTKEKKRIKRKEKKRRKKKCLPIYMYAYKETPTIYKPINCIIINYYLYLIIYLFIFV